MATKKSKSKSAKRTTSRASESESRVTVDRGNNGRSERKSNENFLDRIQNDLEKNQSYLNLILGALIVIVLGVLIFNYFNKPTEEAGIVTPVAEQTVDESGDVTKESLPGKYTVKEGDTLFTIAQKYYDEGGKYTEIVRENNLPGESIEVGQELTIPELEDALAAASASPESSASPSASPETETAMASASPEASATPEAMAEASPSPMADIGTGGAENATTWGETISGDTYTVQANDWLSKIAGRAYGDITRYQAIAQANNITNPDNIEVGVVLKIPRN